jgi:hypothetical protein
MAQLGYSTVDFTSVSRSRRLPLTATDISVRTPKIVTFVHDGRTEELTTTDTTVSQLLADMSVTVGAEDRLSPAAGSVLVANETIVLKRIRHARITATVPIPFKITAKDDSSLPTGQTQVITAGKNGLARVTYALVYIDGKIAGRTTLARVVLKAPTSKVEKVGTKSAVPNVSHVASVSPGSAQAIAQGLLKARGWGADQFDCLVTLWNHESHWNTHAANPSGAYGIPQALPGSKMGSAGPDWQDNAETQIKWGLGYISSRYGTPCGAWSSWQSQGGWY